MRQNQKSLPALALPLPALMVPLPVHRFPNIVAAEVANNIPINPKFCCFPSFFFIFSFINKPYSSSDLTISIIQFISLFEVIDVVLPDPNNFSQIATFVTDGTAINPNVIKKVLANDLSTFE